jgi:hypothetical protein
MAEEQLRVPALQAGVSRRTRAGQVLIVVGVLLLVVAVVGAIAVNL